jgi:acetyl-CoA acyltransferase
MNRKTAEEHGYKPKAVLRSYTYVAKRPGDELLIGPALAVPQVLDDMDLSLDDIDVFEFHEAFAGQMLTVLKALASDDFAKERLNRKKAVGKVPYDTLNSWGGSLSIGHPFGATGVRLVTTAANRLIDSNGKYALFAACAAGGQGHAMIIERFES